jgi:hypothetical protein
MDGSRGVSGTPEPDDLGFPVPFPEVVHRVVSLVPSLTEAIAATAPRLLVGVTNWCSHPPGLRVARVGGTKSPDVAAIAALAPDLVVANEEENRPADIAQLRALGLAVWVTRIRELTDAFSSLHRMITLACGTAWGRALPGIRPPGPPGSWRRPASPRRVETLRPAWPCAPP